MGTKKNMFSKQIKQLEVYYKSMNIQLQFILDRI